MKNEEHPRVAKKPRRPGRPTGSGKLTPEIQENIVKLLGAGAYPSAAARAAGIGPRTYWEWIARGEGRSDRPATPEYVEFARQVRIAQGQAQCGASIRVHRDDPKNWLAHVGGGTEDEPGWTEPRADTASAKDLDAEQISKLREPELEQEYFRLLRPQAADGTFAMPPCPDAECTCPLHDNYERRMEEMNG